MGVRVLTVAEELERTRRPRRVFDQITGSGTSPGAHLFEANEAVSRADFANLVGGAAKEMSETIYWLLVVSKKRWIAEKRLAPLIQECSELLRICKSIVARTRARTAKKRP